MTITHVVWFWKVICAFTVEHGMTRLSPQRGAEGWAGDGQNVQADKDGPETGFSLCQCVFLKLMDE